MRVEDEHLSIHDVAARLGVHYMTAYRYVRLGVLPARKVGNSWQIRSADVAALEQEAASAGVVQVSGEVLGTPPPARPGGRRVAWSTRLEARLLAGDSTGSWSVLEAAQASGASVTDLYLDVVSPALRSIGDRWSRGEIDVADEHQASAVAMRLLGRLAPRLARPGRRRRSVVVGGIAGDHHSLPVTMAADLIGSLGFNVVDLGANVPPASFLHAAEHAPRLGLVAVCVTVSDLVPAAGELVDALHAALPGTPVAVGGQAVSSAAAAEALGADLWAPDALVLAGRIEGRDHQDG